MTRWYVPYAKLDRGQIWLYGNPFSGYRLTPEQARALAAQLVECAAAAELVSR